MNHPIPSTDGAMHFVGLGGAGMSALAEQFRAGGRRVTGSDSAAGGAHPPHAAEHVSPATRCVVHSSAIPEDNSELRRARELRIPILSYGEALGRWLHARRGVAVAGTHGKSTTAAMLAHLLHAAGRPAGAVYGAKLLPPSTTPKFDVPKIDAPAAEVEPVERWRIAEACEYRGQFLHLRPEVGVITGIEWDHVDCYPDSRSVLHAFTEFAAGIPAEGCLIFPHGEPGGAEAARGSRAAKFTFGGGGGASWRAERVILRRGAASFTLVFRDRPLGRVALRVAGMHNVANALAAAAAAWVTGLAGSAICHALSTFPGIRRRLQVLPAWRGLLRADDYAHHPTAVTAALRAARHMFPGREICCLFQPHQGWRTEALLGEFGRSLASADRVLITEIFAARETPPGDSPRRQLARAVNAAGGRAGWAPPPEEAADWLPWLRRRLAPGSVLLTMGAGDVPRYHEGGAA